MIHAAGTQHRIVHTYGNARTQQCVQDNRQLKCRYFTDVKTYPISVQRASLLQSRHLHGRQSGQIAHDPQAIGCSAVCRRARA
jgi:hypothetical protein